MKALEVKELYTLSETLAAPLLESVTYPWEALPKIHDFILKLGESLSEEGSTRNAERISGLPALPRWLPPRPSPVPHHWKGYRGTPLCLYPWKCPGGSREP